MLDAAALSTPGLLRLLQLSNPVLPIGGFAHSLGLESAAELGRVRDEAGAREWIETLLAEVQGRTEVPLLARMYRACELRDDPELDRWAAFLQATRESAELADADRQQGSSLAQLLAALGIEEARRWAHHPDACMLAPFALAASRWEIPLGSAALGLLFGFAANQVAAAVRILPLGQTAGQRILYACTPIIERAVVRGLSLEDAEIGASAPARAIASALHETQYTRLYLS